MPTVLPGGFLYAFDKKNAVNFEHSTCRHSLIASLRTFHDLQKELVSADGLILKTNFRKSLRC